MRSICVFLLAICFYNLQICTSLTFNLLKPTCKTISFKEMSHNKKELKHYLTNTSNRNVSIVPNALSMSRVAIIPLFIVALTKEMVH